MSAEAFSRWYLAIFFVVVAVFYAATIMVKTTRTGQSPVTFGSPGSRHWLVHTTFRVFRLLIMAICLARLPYPQIDAWLVPIEALWLAPVLLTGNAMMLLSLVGLIHLHGEMGTQWRSGVPEDDTSTLITTGAFARTRNPMFILIQLAQLGFFFSLPTVFSLACLVVGIAAIQVQARIEEQHLAARHGEAYARYRKRVPRWLLAKRQRDLRH